MIAIFSLQGLAPLNCLNRLEIDTVNTNWYKGKPKNLLLYYQLCVFFYLDRATSITGNNGPQRLQAKASIIAGHLVLQRVRICCLTIMKRCSQYHSTSTATSARSSRTFVDTTAMRRVRDDMPWKLWVVAIIAFWERAAFWGITGPWRKLRLYSIIV